MNVGISTRLAAPLVALSALILALGIGAAWYVRTLQQNTAEMVTNHMASVRTAYELEINIREFRRRFFRYLNYGNLKDLEAVPQLRANTERWLDEAERLAFTPIEKEQIGRVRRGYGQFLSDLSRLTRVPPTKETYALFHDEIEDLVRKEFLEPTEEFQKLNESMLARIDRDNQAMAGRLIASLVALGVCGAAGGLLVGWLTASSVRRSIRRTEQNLRTTARQLNRVVGAKSVPPEGGGGELDAAVQSLSASAAAVLERLDRTQRDALRAEQLAYVGQMAAGIAHEVRNPLMAMKILVQKAIERKVSEPFRPRDLQVLEGEIERVEQIVTHFLEYARPPRIEKRILNTRPLLERISGSLAARAEQQQVCIRFRGPLQPIFLDADVGQIQQVFYNLMVNALDALSIGGEISIELALEQTRPETAGQAVIRISDNGPGLPAALGERIFEPFISSKEAGLGLGLSICRRIVEAHGGNLRGVNKSTGGAVFTIHLPVAAAPVAVPAN